MTENLVYFSTKVVTQFFHTLFTLLIVVQMTRLPCCLRCTKWLRWLAFGVPFCRDCSTSSACLLSTRTLEYKSGSARASSCFLILVSRSFNFSCSAAGLAPNRFRLGACQFPKNKEETYSSTVSGGIEIESKYSKHLSKAQIS